METTADYSLLFGQFYPEYDIVVSVLWVFIILSGIGNWVVIWCVLKTKTLCNPINMLVVALAFSNGVATTIVGPMDFSRILMAYPQVSFQWCDARIFLNTFCFSVSMMIMFSLGAMRLSAGLRKTPEKPTFKKIGKIIAAIYSVAFLTAPFGLDRNDRTYRTCLGHLPNDVWIEILQNEGLLTATRKNASAEKEVHYIQTTTHHGNLYSEALQDIKTTISAISNFSNMTFPNDKVILVNSNMPELWMYYLIVTFALFVGTIICYISLIIIIKRHNNAMKGMILGNSMDILTMRVTAYVTFIFVISFLIPFIPALTLVNQKTASVLHYVSIFHCLSFLDGAATPIIFISNPVYRKSLVHALPNWIKSCFRLNTQTASMSFPMTRGSSVTVSVVSTHVV